MRTLELNKSNLWYVESMGEIDVVDDDGYFTGEIDMEYSIPVNIKLHLYPASGEVKELTFGKSVDIDMITSSTNIILGESGLLYLTEPTGNYDNTYDYKVEKILKSLNSYQYGLKGRV